MENYLSNLPDYFSLAPDPCRWKRTTTSTERASSSRMWPARCTTATATRMSSVPRAPVAPAAAVEEPAEEPVDPGRAMAATTISGTTRAARRQWPGTRTTTVRPTPRTARVPVSGEFDFRFPHTPIEKQKKKITSTHALSEREH